MYLGTEGRMVIYTAWPHLPAVLQAQILGQKWYWSSVESKMKLLKCMEFKVAVLVSDCMKLEMQWEKARMTPRSLTWRLVHGCCIHQGLVYGRKNMVFVICASNWSRTFQYQKKTVNWYFYSPTTSTGTKQVCQHHFSNSTWSLCVTVSHIGNSPNISNLSLL